MPLMIVESPAKTKTIQKYLGDSWDVTASIGHIRELSKSHEKGYDLKTLRPIYQISKEKKKVVNNLKALTKKHNNDVYLATDLDREGECIAWHLKEVLNLKNPKRVVFNEITKKSIQKSIQNPREIDNNLVEAANARRIIDRMIGFIVSPAIIGASQYSKLSAGRVQSPAVKIIHFREKEIENHQSKNFYTIVLDLENNIQATLETKPFGKHIFDSEIIVDLLKIKALKNTETIKERKIIEPLEPFTTATLVQASGKNLKFTTKQTMDFAQQLFDKGLITYHRTDSTALSEEGYDSACNYMISKGYSTVEQRQWKNKKGSQEAHEAIRPTKYGSDSNDLNVDLSNLLKLIQERTLATTLESAVDELTKYSFIPTSLSHVKVNGTNIVFTSKGTVELSPGWREFVVLEKREIKTTTLPIIEKDLIIAVEKSNLKESKTKPPPRFTERSLIAAMDKLLIGRPSTYASIIENIKNREYVKLNKGDDHLKIQEKGVFIVESLNEMKFMNLDYTKTIEQALDKISKGVMTYFSVVEHIYKTINTEVLSLRNKEKKLLCPNNCGSHIRQVVGKKKNVFWIHIENNHSCESYIADNNNKPITTIYSVCPKGCGVKIKKISSLKKADTYYWVHINNNHNCSKYINNPIG